MAAGGNDSDRQPQFTSSDYEIPSWQIAWNKPWYQQFERKHNSQSKYNSRGHDFKCRCVLCEEDLESAFSPEPNDSPHLFMPNISQERKQKETNAFPAKEKEQMPQTQRRENVILFSDLPEVSRTQAESTSFANTEFESTSNLNGFNPSGFHPTGIHSGDDDPDRLFGSIGAIASIQSVSDRVKDIQTRVDQFSGNQDSREFIILRGLLVTSLAEITRINAVGIEWLQMAKNMAVESIHDILTQLQDKIKDDDDY